MTTSTATAPTDPSTDPATTSLPAPVTDADSLVEWAASSVPCSPRVPPATTKMAPGSTSRSRQLRDSGFLAAAVPRELGGLGATIRQVTMAQRELARHCGSTALASAMHQHVTAFPAWRYRRGMPGAEATLRRVADDRIVIVSSGGADFTRPRGTASEVEGGYRLSGHKVFASQSPVGTAMSSMFAYDDPERGMRVLNVAVPLSAPEVTVGRATGTHSECEARQATTS